MPTKRAASRNPKRKSGSRPTNVVSREQRVASLRYRLSDAVDALRAALTMRNWAGVAKYAKQAQEFETALYRVENAPSRASKQFPFSATTAGAKYGRGKLP